VYLPSATICLHSVQPVHSLKAPGAQCVGQSQWHHEVHGSACTTGRRCCKKIHTKGDAAHHAPWRCRMVCRNVASPRTRMLCCEGAARRRRARGGRLASTRIGRLHKCVEKLFGSVHKSQPRTGHTQTRRHTRTKAHTSTDQPTNQPHTDLVGWQVSTKYRTHARTRHTRTQRKKLYFVLQRSVTKLASLLQFSA
jgi:hypothetical protein